MNLYYGSGLTSPRTVGVNTALRSHFVYMSKLLAVIIAVILSGCSHSRSVIDMSSYSLDEFEKASNCDFDYQCKTILFGYDGCVSNIGDYHRHIIYSTKIGKENVKILKEKIILDRAYKIENQRSLWECVSGRKTVPIPICKNNTCIDRNEKNI
ncbi:hypothetical protein DFR28_108102 [Arenicella xantha]|uniref:Uncharacterized protein n=1 Tax=Arenicella xantha TaxID=644221 RepID=A0A395JFF5_9GAMM|nr:hypothetical protein DFR28_108102 [Arenicella xantha]